MPNTGWTMSTCRDYITFSLTCCKKYPCWTNWTTVNKVPLGSNAVSEICCKEIFFSTRNKILESSYTLQPDVCSVSHTTLVLWKSIIVALLMCRVNISVREAQEGASNSVGWTSLTDHWRRNPFTACPPWPMSRDTTQAHGPGLPKNNLRLLRWQMLLLVLVTGYPSYSAPYFPVNSKVNSVRQNPGRLGSCLCPKIFPQVAATRRPESPSLSAGALWGGFTSPSQGPAGFILKVKHTTP